MTTKTQLCQIYKIRFKLWLGTCKRRVIIMLSSQ